MDQDPTQPFKSPAEPEAPEAPAAPVTPPQAADQPAQPAESAQQAAQAPASPWQPAPAAPTPTPWQPAQAAPPPPPGASAAQPGPSPWQPSAPPPAPAPGAQAQPPYGGAPVPPYGGAPVPPYSGTPTQPYGGTPTQPYAGAPVQPYGAAGSYGTPGQPTVGPGGSYGAPPPSGFEAPVAPLGGRPRRRSPLRYVVALLIVVLVVASGVGATLLLTGSSGGTSSLAGYAPADSIVYAEARLDLPGSQRAEVAKTLAAFPGFADQSALNAKLGELFDRIAKAATKGKHDYQSEIAPWFGGQLAVAEGPQGGINGVTGFPGTSPAPSPTISPTASLPPCTGGDTAQPTATPVASDGFGGMGSMAMSIRTLGLASITDATKASAWVASILGETSTKTIDRTCDGVTVHVVQTANDFVRMPDMGWAILGDKVLVAGDIDSIRLAIATKGTSGLSSVTGFQKATASLSGDHLGLFYEALQATVKAQADALAQLGATSSGDNAEGTDAMIAAYGVLVDMMPEFVVGDLKAANGNVVIDTAQPRKDFQSATNRTSDLAALAPSKTIALMDVHDVGKMLASIKDKFAANPKLAKYVQQLDTSLNLAGGFAGTIGWLGDAGFAVTRDGSKVSGGILVRPDDSAAGKRLVDQVRALVQIGGSSSGIQFKDETYKGATISSVDLSSLAPAIQSSMGYSGVNVPADLQFVYTVTDKAVAFSLDKDFVKAVIDASQGGDSLAKDARFSALLDQASSKNTGLTWLDITAIREVAEASLPASARTQYDADVRPYLLPIDALVMSSLSDGELLRGTMILSIKH